MHTPHIHLKREHTIEQQKADIRANKHTNTYAQAAAAMSVGTHAVSCLGAVQGFLWDKRQAGC